MTIDTIELILNESFFTKRSSVNKCRLSAECRVIEKTSLAKLRNSSFILNLFRIVLIILFHLTGGQPERKFLNLTSGEFDMTDPQ